MILRRDYPEPFIALLVFILGIWLWDHYFGKQEGYAPGTEEMALVKIDRDLRLADAMVDDSVWLKWLAGVREPVEVRREAMEALEKLSDAKSISPRGVEAYAIIKAEQDGLPIRQVLGQALRGQMISDFETTSRDLATHRGTWWHAKLIDSWEEHARPGAHWRQSHGEDTIQLKTRAVWARSAIWLIGVVGLVFLPGALICLRKGFSAKLTGYAAAWPLQLGLVVFLVATLAWIGFSMTLELGIGALPNLHPAMGIFLDSTARLLPTAIAMGLLFRRGSHASRVMGMGNPVPVRKLLGVFSLLMLIDQVLSRVMPGIDPDPAGGLSIGESGWWGLGFAVVSACLLAPIAEETLYRGVLFRSFRNKLGVPTAALLSSAIFAMLHFYDGYGLLSVGIFGFCCALLYSSTGSLAAVIALHMLYNASIKIPEWIVYQAPLG